MSTARHRRWVLDTSSILEIDRFFDSPDSASAGAGVLGGILNGLAGMAADGRLFLPVQVRDECRSPRVAEFAERTHRECSDLEPSYQTIREVMACVGDVVSLTDEADVADPWVLAQAIELSREGSEVWLVTEDRRDRLPKKLSLMTAAERLGIDACRVFWMLKEEGLWP